MIEIKTGDIRTAVMLSRQLPEFVEPAGEEEYHGRLEGKRKDISQPNSIKKGSLMGSFYLICLPETP